MRSPRARAQFGRPVSAESGGSAAPRSAPRAAVVWQRARRSAVRSALVAGCRRWRARTKARRCRPCVVTNMVTRQRQPSRAPSAPACLSAPRSPASVATTPIVAAALGWKGCGHLPASDVAADSAPAALRSLFEHCGGAGDGPAGLDGSDSRRRERRSCRHQRADGDARSARTGQLSRCCLSIASAMPQSLPIRSHPRAEQRSTVALRRSLRGWRAAAQAA